MKLSVNWIQIIKVFVISVMSSRKGQTDYKLLNSDANLCHLEFRLMDFLWKFRFEMASEEKYYKTKVSWTLLPKSFIYVDFL